MNSYLWVQWKKSTDPSRFIIDGTLSEYSGTEQQCDVMQVLEQVSNFKEVFKKRKDDGHSISFRLSISKTEVSTLRCVEGNFKEVDEAGRKLTYIFVTNEIDPIKIAKILQEYADILGLTLYPDDLKTIKQVKFKKINFKTILICAIIIILLLLSILLSHLNE